MGVVLETERMVETAMRAGNKLHPWVGSKPIGGLEYLPVVLTVQTHEDA